MEQITQFPKFAFLGWLLRCRRPGRLGSSLVCLQSCYKCIHFLVCPDFERLVEFHRCDFDVSAATLDNLQE